MTGEEREREFRRLIDAAPPGDRGGWIDVYRSLVLTNYVMFEASRGKITRQRLDAVYPEAGVFGTIPAPPATEKGNNASRMLLDHVVELERSGQSEHARQLKRILDSLVENGVLTPPGVRGESVSRSLGGPGAASRAPKVQAKAGRGERGRVGADARSPAWTADELILALDVYVRIPSARSLKGDPAVAELSDVLRSLPVHTDSPDPATFRNTNGVYMKLQNFKAIDPEYLAGGGLGLRRDVTRLMETLWERYADHPEELRAVADAIRANISAPAPAADDERTGKRKLEELGFEVVSPGDQRAAWWAGDPDEIYWLEITDRPDIGIDLHCPQVDAAGHASPGYSLINEVSRNDIVFHYDRNARAIASWSRAVGDVVERPTVWLSHRGETRRRVGVAVE